MAVFSLSQLASEFQVYHVYKHLCNVYNCFIIDLIVSYNSICEWQCALLRVNYFYVNIILCMHVDETLIKNLSSIYLSATVYIYLDL